MSQRVLVALDTGKGVIYASASGWDCIRLYWMFRNFHSLPQKVLNLRQQQLVRSLYREALNRSEDYPYDAAVAGTVEDFDPSSLSALPVSEHGGQFVRSVYARFAFNRRTLRVAAGLLVAIIAILAWHQLGAQPVPSASIDLGTAALTGEPQSSAQDLGAAITRPVLDPVAALPSPTPFSNVAPSAKLTVATPVRAIAMAETSAKRSARPIAASRNTATNALSQSGATGGQPFATLPGAREVSAEQPRMQISGRPRKLIYPVCPETGARGKVSLQAVVGLDGAVDRVKVLTGDRVLAAAAVEAVRQWRYEPFSGAVQQLERETNITVSFISNEVVAVSFPDSISISR